MKDLKTMIPGLYKLSMHKEVGFLWWKRRKLVPYGILQIIQTNAKCRQIKMTVINKQRTEYQAYINNDGLILSRYIKLSSKVQAVTVDIDLFDKCLFGTLHRCYIEPNK